MVVITPKRIKNALMLLVAVAILVPVTAYTARHARAVSQQQTCAQNLKVMGEACKMYQDDWHDVLVPYGAPIAWHPPGIWPNLLRPYLRKIVPPDEPRRLDRLFRCPSYSVEEGTAFCVEWIYGMNERCGGWFPDKKPAIVLMNSIKYPSSTVRIAEVSWQAQAGSYFAARPSEFIPGDRTCHLFPTRHMGKGNVLWIDGHVSSMTLEQYNMRDKGPYDGNIWLRLEGPKPLVP